MPTTRRESPFSSLGDYVKKLEQVGELKRIKVEVSRDQELAEILRRLVQEGGPAVIFENVKGYRIPVLGNAFGTLARMNIALQTENFEDLGGRITGMLSMPIPSGLVGKVKALPKLREISDYAPKIVRTGKVHEDINSTDCSLLSLPSTKSWPKDAGRFITFGLVMTKDHQTGSRNMGLYRIQIFDEKTAVIHWQPHKRGAAHYRYAMEERKDIDVAIVIGADPFSIFAGIAPVPEPMDKVLFAGILRGKGIELVKCKTVDLEVPANGEIVLEGKVKPDEFRIEGPFGDHTGYYTPPEPYPVFHLTAITNRKNPLFLTTVVGKPVMEDAFIGKAIERSFLPLMKFFHPEIVDFSLPPAGWFQGLAVVSIKKSYPGQAKKVMFGLWSLGQMMLTKMIVVLDSDVNIHDVNEMIWAVTTRTDPKRDILILENSPTDTLDPASPVANLGSKLGVDATTKWKEEGLERDSLELAKVDDKVRDLVRDRWREYFPNTAPG
ncbi:MAG: menaquinone biosynthesis decarboxylase [Nitrososphaerales archaeon]